MVAHERPGCSVLAARSAFKGERQRRAGLARRWPSAAASDGRASARRPTGSADRLQQVRHPPRHLVVLEPGDLVAPARDALVDSLRFGRGIGVASPLLAAGAPARSRRPRAPRPARRPRAGAAPASGCAAAGAANRAAWSASTLASNVTQSSSPREVPISSHDEPVERLELDLHGPLGRRAVGALDVLEVELAQRVADHVRDAGIQELASGRDARDVEVHDGALRQIARRRLRLRDRDASRRPGA